MAQAVVIGAGVAGLATAALLAREGYDVTIYERGDRVGGRAGWIEDAGFRFETGPSWYLMPEVFDHYFRLLGTSAAEQLDLVRLDPGYRVYPEGQASVDVRSGLNEIRELVESREPGGAAAIEDYLNSSDRAMDLAVKEFLYNTFSAPSSVINPRVLRSAPDIVRWLSTDLASYAAKRFSDPVVRQLLGYSAVFLGTDPRKAPAIYHLMNRMDLVEGVFYPQGGFTRVVSALRELAEAEGVRIVLNAEVTEIGVVGGHAKGVRWRERVPDGAALPDGAAHLSQTGPVHKHVADVVVSAADLHHTETQLLPTKYQTWPERAWKTTVPGPSGVIAMLGVEGELDLPHHSLMLTRDWDTNFDSVFGGSQTPLPDPVSLYVCRPSATDPDVAPSGMENLFVLIPTASDVSLGGSGSPEVERIADAAIAQVAQWAGIPDLASRIRVRHTLGPADFAANYHSWRGGILGPAHLLKQSAMFRRGNASRKVRGLYYAGGTVSPGVGVPMCLISAELVIKHLRGDRSTGPLPEPLLPEPLLQSEPPIASPQENSP